METESTTADKPKSRLGGKREGAGRKRHPIDMKQLESLCAAQCTDEEISAHVGVTRRAWAEIKKRPEIDDAIRKGRAKGIGSLRSAQFKSALSGNPAMLIWMGKQLLGQKESPVEMSGSVNVSEHLSVTVLSIEELRELYRLRRKMESSITQPTNGKIIDVAKLQ